MLNDKAILLKFNNDDYSKHFLMYFLDNTKTILEQ